MWLNELLKTIWSRVEKEFLMIYAIDARDNIYLESMALTMGMDNSDVFNAIDDLHLEFLDELKKVDVNYSDLKNCLIPQKKKREIALVFDSEITGSSIYGVEILTKLLSVFKMPSCNSILLGDLIVDANYRNEIKAAFFQFIVKEKEINYISNELFFIVYINNLSEFVFDNIRTSLNDYPPYVGFFDLTFSSSFKNYISTILVRSFIVHKNEIIVPNEITGIYNPTWYPFEEYGFKCKSVSSEHYGLFLSYKIERPANLSGEDVRFSLNAISTTVFNLSDFQLIIDESKFKYLFKSKNHSLNRAGLSDMSVSDLENEIRLKINSNYIFNLRLSPNTIQFNIMIEAMRSDSGKKTKLLVALEYAAEKKILRLITIV